MTHPAANPPTRSRIAGTTLIAVLTVMVIELIRTSGPIEDHGFSAGIGTAAAISFAMYLAPGVLVGALLAAVVLIVRPVRARVLLPTALWWGTIALVVARLAVQALGVDSGYVLAMATIALGVGLETLAVARVGARSGGRTDATLGVLVGAGVAALMQLFFVTWDPIWQSGPVAWTVVALECLIALGAAFVARTEVPDLEPSARVWALGPFLALGTMSFLSSAFVSSASALPLADAALLITESLFIAVLAVVAVTMCTKGTGLSRGWWAILSAAFVAGIAAMYWLPAGWVIPALVITSVAGGLLLTMVCTPAGGDQQSSAWSVVVRQALAAAAAGVSILLTQLLYQLDYDQPLPVSNVFVLLLSAAIFAAAGYHRPLLQAEEPPEPARGWARLTRIGRTPRVATAGALTAIVVAALFGAGATATHTDRSSTAATSSIRLLDWNLHYSVSDGPAVRLDDIADTIEDAGADVVTLQEVNRGWVFGAGTDTAQWLAKRLHMHMVWAPAADEQFGNLILSRWPLTDVSITDLPYGQGPQHRSAISGTLDLDGTGVRITSVHLQHRNENSPTRSEQIRTLLAAQGDHRPAIIAGDMNAYPHWKELDLYRQAGYQSAQDEVGDPTQFTSPSWAPDNRIDYVWGAGLTFSDFELGTSTASDHLPLAVTITAP